MIYLWKMNVCWHEIINIIYRGSRFIAFSSTPPFFLFTERYLVAYAFRLFSFPDRRESEQTWISSAIDCLPHNSSFYLEGCIVESEYPPWDQLRSTI